MEYLGKTYPHGSHFVEKKSITLKSWFVASGYHLGHLALAA